MPWPSALISLPSGVDRTTLEAFVSRMAQSYLSESDGGPVGAEPSVNPHLFTDCFGMLVQGKISEAEVWDWVQIESQGQRDTLIVLKDAVQQGKGGEPLDDMRAASMLIASDLIDVDRWITLLALDELFPKP